jgi:integrase
MNFVQPIRDKEKLEEMKEELKKKGTRNYIMFYTGINTGLRVSDIIKLNYNDIRDLNGNMKSHITIIEKKTGKMKKFPIYNGLYSELEKYTRNMKPSEYLFKSQMGNNKHITTTQAYRIIVNAGKNICLTEIGTHTMRKTFGYWHYQQYHDVAMLQTIFNHSSPSITLKYIGINQDEIDKSYRDFSL